MLRGAVLTDEMWARIEPVLPLVKGAMGRPMRDHRLLVEAAIYRYRTGIPWRDLPAEFGPWQTAWKRHHRFSLDGTWDKVLTVLQAQADAAGEIDWRVSVDSTIARVHQHAATLARSSEKATSHTGARSNDKNPGRRKDEPNDHAIGRSRGGLTTKTHALVDGRGLPLVFAVTPGQAGDSPALPRLLAELRVPRLRPDRPRTTPEALRGERRTPPAAPAPRCAPAASRQSFRSEPTRSLTGRTMALAAGIHPRSTPRTTSSATSSSAHSTGSSSGAAWPAATTSSPWSTAADSSSARSPSGCHDLGDTR